MAKRVSRKPDSFVGRGEEEYWHMAQDIAFRAGAAIELRDGATWLVDDAGERLLCQTAERIWWKTWLVLKEEFPALSRMFVQFRPISKPGE